MSMCSVLHKLEVNHAAGEQSLILQSHMHCPLFIRNTELYGGHA